MALKIIVLLKYMSNILYRPMKEKSIVSGVGIYWVFLRPVRDSILIYLLFLQMQRSNKNYQLQGSRFILQTQGSMQFQKILSTIFQ